MKLAVDIEQYSCFIKVRRCSIVKISETTLPVAFWNGLRQLTFYKGIILMKYRLIDVINRPNLI
jgi:hypothetical protein